jgi:hypothetical protein
MTTITVIFLDGSEQVFTNADYRVREGVLEVWEDSYSGRRDTHHFPLASIRTWRVSR